MSSKALQQLATRMLTQLNKKGVRDDVERHEGQLYFFDKESFILELQGYFMGYEYPKSAAKAQAKKLANMFEGLLTNLSHDIPKVLNKRLDRRKKELYGQFPTTGKFYNVKNFKSVASAKSKVGEAFANSVNQFKGDAEYNRAKGHVTGYVGAGENIKNVPGQQIAHGEHGLAVSATKASAAASGYSNYMAKNPYENTTTKAIKEALIQYNASLPLSIDIIKDTEVTATGKFKAKFIPILSGQAVIENAEDKNLEQAAINALRSTLSSIREGLINQKGSPSIKDSMESVITEVLLTGVKGKVKHTGTGKPKKSVKTKSKGGTKGTLKVRGSVNVGRSVKGGPLLKTNESTKAPNSLYNLVALLNEKLEAVLKKNMVAPALVWRTGRFAKSVKVSNITATAKGYPRITYEYLGKPYSMFEMGRSGLASWDRDPRNIIDKSIREIAAGAAGERFYTQREFAL